MFFNCGSSALLKKKRPKEKYIKPIILYGSESWKITKVKEEKLNIF
jgi:hypothetical protein